MVTQHVGLLNQIPVVLGRLGIKRDFLSLKRVQVTFVLFKALLTETEVVAGVAVKPILSRVNRLSALVTDIPGFVVLVFLL